MSATTPWDAIHAERAALIVDLEQLKSEQWATPSLCAGWSVNDVLAHLVATAKMTPPRFFARLAAARFRFTSMTAKEVAAEGAGVPGQTLDRFRDLRSATTHPPGPLAAMVGEVVIHGEDIRRPLGIAHTYPAEVLVSVADFYKGSNLLLGSKRRIAGLALKASDADWTTGTGPEVVGPMASLVLVIAGRRAGLADVSGEGTDALASRMG